MPWWCVHSFTTIPVSLITSTTRSSSRLFLHYAESSTVSIVLLSSSFALKSAGTGPKVKGAFGAGGFLGLVGTQSFVS